MTASPLIPTTRLDRGVALTEIGFGASQLGNLGRSISDAEAFQAVDAAWGAGIRYFDTAPHYGLGLSEQRLGAALRGRPRNEYAISTKVGRLLVDAPAGSGLMDDQGFDVPATKRRIWDFSRSGILRSLEESLLRLGLDRVDILYLHDPDGHEREVRDEAIPALVELREAGVIGAIGLGMNQSAMPARLVRDYDLDVVMLAGRYTLLEQDALDDLLPLAHERGVAIIAAGVYNSGLLARHDVPAAANYDYAPASADLLDRARRLAAICERFDVSLPGAALQFPNRHPAVAASVVGLRTAGHVTSTLERLAEQVPEPMWRALIDEALVRDFAVPSAEPRP